MFRKAFAATFGIVSALGAIFVGILLVIGLVIGGALWFGIKAETNHTTPPAVTQQVDHSQQWYCENVSEVYCPASQKGSGDL